MSADLTIDAELLARWRDGDESAGDQLLRRHFLVVTRFFQRRVAPDLVEDMVQRTFVGAVEARDRVPEGVRFKAYLLGIARKQLLRYLGRERSKLDTDPLDAVAEASSLAPSRVVAAREEIAVILAALRLLPEELRVVVELYYCEELGVREVAAALDRPVGTVKTWLHRARGLLRDAVRQADIAEGLRTSTILRLAARET